jgi:hypothetical protein
VIVHGGYKIRGRVGCLQRLSSGLVIEMFLPGINPPISPGAGSPGHPPVTVKAGLSMVSFASVQLSLISWWRSSGGAGPALTRSGRSNQEPTEMAYVVWE